MPPNWMTSRARMSRDRRVALRATGSEKMTGVGWPADSGSVNCEGPTETSLLKLFQFFLTHGYRQWKESVLHDYLLSLLAVHELEKLLY